MPGDEVIISAYTCLAVPAALVAAQTVPVYVDLAPGSIFIDLKKLKASITPRTRAIVVQHTLGNPAPVLDIIKIAKKYQIQVIEDCSLAIGSKCNRRYYGTYGDASIFSFELSKTISSGWGGLLMVNKKKYLKQLILKYKSVPQQNSLHSLKDMMQTIISVLSLQPLFYNICGEYMMKLCWKLKIFRTSTTDAELKANFHHNYMYKMGRGQLLLAIRQWKNFTSICNRCNKNFVKLAQALTTAGVQAHVPRSPKIKPVSNRVSFVVKNKSQIIKLFQKEKIEIGNWFDPPLSPQPRNKRFNYVPRKYPNSHSLANNVLNLPSHSGLSNKNIRQIKKCISDIFKSKKKIT